VAERVCPVIYEAAMSNKFSKDNKHIEKEYDDERKKRKQSGLRRKEQNAKRATKYKNVGSSDAPS
jgi:hypothetical protein